MYTDMKIRTFKYFAKESINSIRRNRVMSFASVSTVAAALFVFGVFMLMALNVDKFMQTVESKVEIKAFLNDSVTTLKQQGIEDQIRQIIHVKSINFESKQQALVNFKKELGSNSDLADGLELDNPLPASYVIKVDKPENSMSVSNQVSKITGIGKVNDGKEIVDQIVKVTRFIKIISIVIMIILGVIAISLISNTIKLTVYARKREISIMKYIGATDWFVKWPFIMEGILLGLLGAILSIALLILGYSFVSKAVSTGIIVFSLVPPKEIVTGLIYQFSLIGMVIGGIGSLLSIRRFLII